ncbi:Uncharacterised protein [Escherichia coli]|nr:Uncharacterised protein [Escherichia coli]
MDAGPNQHQERATTAIAPRKIHIASQLLFGSFFIEQRRGITVNILTVFRYGDEFLELFVFIQIFTAEPTEDTDRQDTD